MKNAIVYSAELPDDPKVMESHLKERQFKDPAETQYASSGFYPHKHADHDNCELLAVFPGGYAFTVRVDERLIPKKLVHKKAAEIVQVLSTAQGRALSKKEKSEVVEKVYLDLLPSAFVTTKLITGYYLTEQKLLLVDTTTSSLADTVTRHLVAAVGSIKAQTIYISDIKNGLKTRLLSTLKGENRLGDFVPVDALKMATGEGEKIVYSGSMITSQSEEIIKQLEGGFLVNEIRVMHHQMLEFTLTEKFRMKRISNMAEPDQDDEVEDQREVWRHETAVTAKLVASAVDDLCQLLEYKKPEPTEEQSQ